MKVSLPGPRQGAFTRNPVAGIRRSPDIRRMAKALQSRNIDTRFWFSAGTVGHLDDRGTFIAEGDEAYIGSGNDRRALAVAVEDDGVLVDVRLEPSGEYVTARYHGLGVGQFGAILFPILPGDEVVVAVPDGDLNSPAISIVTIASNIRAQIPTTWANDRVLFQARGPIEITAPAIAIDSNNLVLNGRTVTRSGETI